jgi:hypothetical protein
MDFTGSDVGVGLMMMLLLGVVTVLGMYILN